MKYKQFLILFMKMHPMRCIVANYTAQDISTGFIFYSLNVQRKTIYIYIPIKADYNYIETQKFRPFYMA